MPGAALDFRNWETGQTNHPREKLLAG